MDDIGEFDLGEFDFISAGDPWLEIMNDVYKYCAGLESKAEQTPAGAWKHIMLADVQSASRMTEKELSERLEKHLSKVVDEGTAGIKKEKALRIMEREARREHGKFRQGLQSYLEACKLFDELQLAHPNMSKNWICMQMAKKTSRTWESYKQCLHTGHKFLYELMKV